MSQNQQTSAVTMIVADTRFHNPDCWTDAGNAVCGAVNFGKYLAVVNDRMGTADGVAL
ncbi:hypothetical protein O6P37_23390 [Mycobacterium sp. CPCC 205372]|uniref:Uncharacterized protein n=1 Tax=Mycobacterium hippophais TaxID=3016340 RepID=A0ABT4PZE9_9MYCO|nr:hypothetical protein [Mycobacterium hippophais]